MAFLANKLSTSWRDRLAALAPAFLRPYWERLKASPLGYRLAKGAFWSLAGAGISRGLTLVSSILIARMLGKEGFGRLGVIQNTVGMFGVFAGFGMGLTATKHVAEYRSADPQRAGRVVVLTETVTLATSFLVVLALAVSAPWLAQHTLADTQLGPLLLLGGLLIPFSALNGVQTGALSGLEAFKAIAKANFWSGLLSFPVLLAGAYWWGITGAVLGLVTTQFANCVLSHLALRSEAARFDISLRFTRISHEKGILWDFSFPTVLSNAMGWCANWICTAMLVNQPRGYSEMGIVSASNQWRAALMFLPGLLISATLPMLASEHRNEPRDFGRVMQLSHRMLVFLVVPIALSTMLAAGLIMTLYGHGFAQGRPALVYTLAATAIVAISSPAGSAIIAKGRMWLSLVLTLSNAGIFISLTHLLIPPFGAAGLACAFLAANFLQTVGAYIYLRPELPEGMFSRNIIVMVFLSGFAFCILLL